MMHNGASIYGVQKLLGHHHISITERYAHLLPKSLEERAEIIASSLLNVSE
jgi:site-specific recombinase XerD